MEGAKGQLTQSACHRSSGSYVGALAHCTSVCDVSNLFSWPHPPGSQWIPSLIEWNILSSHLHCRTNQVRQRAIWRKSSVHTNVSVVSWDQSQWAESHTEVNMWSTADTASARHTQGPWKRAPPKTNSRKLECEVTRHTADFPSEDACCFLFSLCGNLI